MKRQTLGLLCGAAVALIVPAAAPVAAQTAHATHAAHAVGGADSDVRCLILSMSMASGQDQNAKLSGLVGMAYYMGRLDAEGVHADLQDRMDAQYVAMKGQNVNAQGQLCGQALQSHMTTMGALGQHMQAKFGGGPAPAQPAAPATTLKPIPSPGSH